MKERIITILISILIFGFFNIPSTNSYFTSQSSVSGQVSTGYWSSSANLACSLLNNEFYPVVNIKQDDQELVIYFDNAAGFDNLKYSIFYNRIYEDQKIEAEITGEINKDIHANQLIIGPVYIGTCSDLGKVCVPHGQVSDLEVHFLYRRAKQIIGSESYDFDWQN